MIEHHGNVAAELLLDPYGILRPQMHHRAIQMRLERRTILANLGHVPERENLKPSTVGQNRSIPTHETMQPPQVCNPLTPRTQRQMVGVAQ